MIIKDCIYGFIDVPELCLAFIDTPEFQRLRRIKQLGLAEYSYPSAVHTRYEHSIGVMHLAGKMVDQLRNFDTITDRTKHLIQLAGLYHDIGHFAFSHLFDVFLDSVEDKDIPEIFKLKSHEGRSIYLLKKINKRLNLLNTEEELFVEHVILGRTDVSDKKYPYEIVCNKSCGVDVDKMDYLRRDAYHTGFPAFQADYIILNAVIDENRSLAFLSKAYADIKDLFSTRERMFSNVYLHHATLKVGKIYFCILKRLGQDLFIFGDMTEDSNIETLIRSRADLQDMINLVDTRQLTHSCKFCEHYSHSGYKSSGILQAVKFISTDSRYPFNPIQPT